MQTEQNKSCRILYKELVHILSMMMLPADNELTNDCQLRYDVSAAPAYHALDKEYNLSTLSLSSANADNK